MTEVKPHNDQPFQTNVNVTNIESVAGIAFERSLSADEVKSKGQPSNTRDMIQNDVRRPPQVAWTEQNSQHQPVSVNEAPPLHPRHPNNRRVYENLGHRRVRSGDAAIWGIHPPNRQALPQQSNMYPIYTSPAYVPNVTHSVSLVDIHTPPQSAGYMNNYSQHPHNTHNPMTHSMSMDMSAGTNHVYEHLTHQTASFVRLQKAIGQANKLIDNLEKDIEKGEIELNALLTAETPTESQYQQIKKENELLLKEIKQMYGELDKLNPSQNDESRSVDNFNQISLQQHPNIRLQPANLQDLLQEKQDDLLTKPMFPEQTGHNTTVRKKTSLPTPPITTQPPTYNSIFDPAPLYHHVVPQTQRPPIPERPPRPLPLPFLAHEELSEHWTCPKCTFKNLLVGECEVCFTPRPITLNRPH